MARKRSTALTDSFTRSSHGAISSRRLPGKTLKISEAPKAKAPEPRSWRPVPHQMPAVDSEAIAQVEYDAASHTLFLRFTSGDWYAYLDVPRPVFDALLAAGSKGAFFQASVRDHYGFVKLDQR